MAATILSVSASATIAHTRQLLLERHGYHVISATALRQIEKACDRMKFDLAVIGAALEGKSKREIAEIIDQKCIGVPMVEISRESCEIRGAISAREGSPEELLTAIHEGLHARERRVSGRLQRQARQLAKESNSLLERSRAAQERSRELLNPPSKGQSPKPKHS